MAKKNKISLRNAYNLTIDENDTVTLKVFLEDDVLDISGKNGSLIIDSAWDEEEEPEQMTLADYIESTKGWLKDWGVDEAAAEAICKDLTPWFERYAMSEAEKIRDTIAKLERMIAYREVSIERKASNIEADNQLIRETRARIEADAKKMAELHAEIGRYEQTIAELKAHL